MRERDVNASSPLLTIPQELIDVITTLITNDIDILALALTNTYFFRLLAPSVKEAVIRDEAPWAGDRLIFVGDYASGVPDGVLTDSELAVLTGVESEEDDQDSGARFSERIPFYDMDAMDVNDRTTDGDIDQDRALHNPWRRRGDRIRRLRNRRLSGEGMALLDRLLQLTSAEPTTMQAVLRCISTKQYVRDSVIAKSEHVYSLGEVLCTHAQWTADPCGTEGLRCEGAWASCRFDIATLADVDAGWEDVSEEAVELLRAADLYPSTDGKRA